MGANRADLRYQPRRPGFSGAGWRFGSNVYPWEQHCLETASQARLIVETIAIIGLHAATSECRRLWSC